MPDHKPALARLWQLCSHTEGLHEGNSFGALLPVIESTRGNRLSCINMARHCIARLTRLNKITLVVQLRCDAFEQTLDVKRSGLEEMLSHAPQTDYSLNLTQTEVLALSKPEMETAACKMELLENTMELDFATRAILVHLSIEQQFRALTLTPADHTLNSFSRRSINEFIVSLPTLLSHLGQVFSAQSSLRDFKQIVEVNAEKLADTELSSMEAIKILLEIWEPANRLANENMRNLAKKSEFRFYATKSVAKRYIGSIARIEKAEMQTAPA